MNNIQHSTFNAEHPTRMRPGRHWTLSVECWLLNVPRSILIFAIRVYRWTISPAQAFLFGSTAGCRFTPTCSQYALEAVRTHGALGGTWLGLTRVCRCHPWGGHGHDPVPRKAFRMQPSEFETRLPEPNL